MADYWGFLPNQGKAYFVSYNSRDWERVAPVAKALNDSGVPIWYDYGLEAGTDSWRKQISESIDRSYGVIVFVSKGIYDRDRCYVLNEYDEAAGLGKTIIPVFLDEVSLADIPPKYRWYTAEWKRLQGIGFEEENKEQTAARIQSRLKRIRRSKIMNRCLAALLAAALILVGIFVAPNLYVRIKDYIDVQKQKAAQEEVFDPGAGKTSDSDTSHISAQNTGDLLYPDIVYSQYEKPSVNNVVYFGSYVQNSELADPLKWIVLDIKDGRALLLSYNLIENIPFNNKQGAVTWETCSLRSWLNNEFLNTAFTPEEQELIEITELENGDSTGNKTANTQDRIFCLSVEETNSYTPIPISLEMQKANFMYYLNHFANDMGDTISDITGITKHAADQALQYSNEVSWYWWYRTTGENRGRACFFNQADGGGNSWEWRNALPTRKDVFVRPALWIRLEAAEE